ncbi:hypothetical protein [Nonomuraea guangzhouensis]|uniref:Uncharacterized protein n=1 Tax=Nonomuraea guangzhouensis TaxID=1291555 RepID=A0ABW4GMF5_9ACTN|nr:hypothetical protein [Nonomuraea guangzhouensis]
MALAVALGAVGLVTAGPAAAASPGWAVLPTPNPGKGSNELSDVSGSSESDFWAVGKYEIEPGGPVRPLALRWEGHSWQHVATPIPAGRSQGELAAVVAIAPGDAWAVGRAATMGGDESGLIMRWRDGSWQLVPGPSAGEGPPSRLNAVAAAGPDDVWAVGETGRAGQTRPLAMHWDGRAWSVVPVPEPPVGDAVLSSVAVRSADEAWAVGYAPSAVVGHGVEPYVLRWNGTSWNRVPVPNDGEVGLALADVAVGPRGEVVATGESRRRGADGDITRRPAVLRYDGTAWRTIPVPASYQSADSYLNDVAISRKGKVWIAGHSPGGEAFATLNGDTWELVDGASPEGFTHKAIAIIDRVWCVGHSLPDDTGLTRTYSEWSPILG